MSIAPLPGQSFPPGACTRCGGNVTEVRTVPIGGTEVLTVHLCNDCRSKAAVENKQAERRKRG